ncbi:sugar ABC transporter substrate-binding protein [Streptomyces sp. MAR4 CNX-425]|uniref:sugar ABC transporter substrate-binding protein n=1 Tax=Streptomyces sp. MAR4 CNX-425 TaxID=3406343 RepID=UPI003B5055E2
MARSTRVFAAVALAALLSGAAACSDSGGKDAEENDGDGGGGGVNTPRMEIAMVTHSAPGDTFWDIVQSGAEQAAAKDNVEFLYANSEKDDEQARLVQTFVDKKVDGIIVTLAKPEAMKSAVQAAVDAGIPVVTINSGAEFSKEYGALSHIGQEETVAGEAVGEELNERGREKAVCVIHEQGNVGLEQRCAGVKETFSGSVRNLTVDGASKPNVLSGIQAELEADGSVDSVVTLNADVAAAAVEAKDAAGSDAEVATFDLNKDVAALLESRKLTFAVDQQPYLQGYLAVDELWLYETNGNVIGGGQTVLTGPAIVTEEDAPELKKFTERGTR